MTTLKDDLLGPGIDLIETHTAWVFLSGELVWKVKKPVDYGFLDYTTLEKRRIACEAELALNRRLAPGVYLRVVPIARDASGKHRLDAPGEPVDFAVEMQRLSDDRRADTLLARDALGSADVDAIANAVAQFHASMPADDRTTSFGLPDSILKNVRENFEQTRDTVRKHLSDAEAGEIEATQLGFIERHRGLFEARARRGRVRDGHGDLRLEHVYLTGERPVVIDCIEFNERFRYADVAADIAFLSMDLARLGRVDFAERLLSAYAAASNDYELYRVIDFYEGYRAYVRGKVASILAADEGAEHTARAAAEREARRYYLLSLSTGRAPLTPPAVVAVGGIIASGKSTWSERVGSLAGAPVLQTDRIRKHLLGAGPTEPLLEPAFRGSYAPESTSRVYDALFEGASAVLGSGRPVVLDASFARRAYRDRARDIAKAHGVPFTFIETRATPETCRERLRRRAESPSVSDARLEVYEDFVAHFEPATELPEDEHLVLDTTHPEAENLEKLARGISSWPARKLP